MKYLIAALFALIPNVAMSQAMNKVDMITEFSDIATLIAAEILECGETDKDRVLAFNGIFDSFMLYTAISVLIDSMTCFLILLVTIAISIILLLCRYWTRKTIYSLCHSILVYIHLPHRN
mgnify:CR=1 FL=1